MSFGALVSFIVFDVICCIGAIFVFDVIYCIRVILNKLHWCHLLCLIGKVGAILASIPLALAASVLCFTWALVVALGLSTLQYSQAASFRNMMIVGVSLFLGLSIPAYFQQYQPETSFILPSYFVPYAAASNGPARTGSKQVRNLFPSFMV